MPFILEGGEDGGITAAEAGGYGIVVICDPGLQRVDTLPGGDRSPEQAQLVQRVEEKIDYIMQGWVDSGGPGGKQQAVAHEILRRAALLQHDVQLAVRQWAKPGRERALAEMMGVLVAAITDRDRLLLELRERLNGSPY